MIRDVVRSSRIAAIGYDYVTNVLEVEFQPAKDGRRSVYAYDGVSEAMYQQLMSAASIGREFSVVDKNYPHRRVATVTADGDEIREDAP